MAETPELAPCPFCKCAEVWHFPLNQGSPKRTAQCQWCGANAPLEIWPRHPVPAAPAAGQEGAGTMIALQAMVRENNKLDALAVHLIDALHRIIEKGDQESRRIAEHAMKQENFKYPGEGNVNGSGQGPSPTPGASRMREAAVWAAQVLMDFGKLIEFSGAQGAQRTVRVRTLMRAQDAGARLWAALGEQREPAGAEGGSGTIPP